MSVHNPSFDDKEERTYVDVLNYLRHAEPDQFAAFRKYFENCKKKDRDSIVGLGGIMRAIAEVETERDDDH